jgi:hypothetical protein
METLRLYRERNLIERFFSKLKHFRRVATRYDKLAANFLAMVQLASGCGYAIMSLRPKVAGSDGDRVCYSSAPKHHAKMPFCACRRFSASSNTTDCGPSITSSVTSCPRCAGRQCMKIASRAAFAISRAFT